jgi:predicted Rossmann-fold nucleotide-binding protein
MNINELKQKSGATHFASVLGKSTIDQNSPEYKAIQYFTTILLKNGYGIIHGGYAGGAMQATSDTVNEYIKENNMPPYLNIGVPQSQHDGLWDRVIGAQFTDIADDIFQRIKVVTSGDIAVICPLGGDGTELEETIVFHENVVRMGMNKYGGYNLKMTPLIFFQTKDGTDWKTLIQKKIDILDVSVENISEYDWLYFIDSLEEFEKLIIKLKTA